MQRSLFFIILLSYALSAVSILCSSNVQIRTHNTYGIQVLLPACNPFTESTLTILQKINSDSLTEEEQRVIIAQYSQDQTTLIKKIAEILNILRYEPLKTKTYAPLKNTTTFSFLQSLLEKAENKSLEAINPETGQNIIHALAPHNRFFGEYLLNQQVNLLIPTENPDLYPGSTILHIIAGYLNSHIFMEKTTSEFFTTVASKYPDILTLTSKPYYYNNGSTIIDLLRKKQRYKNHVSKETIKNLINDLITLRDKHKIPEHTIINDLIQQ